MVTRVVYCRVTRGIVGLPEGLLQGYSGVYCRVTRGVYCRVTRRFIARLPGGLLLPFMVSIDATMAFIVKCFLRSFSELMFI